MTEDQRDLDSLRPHHDAERVPVPDHGDLHALRESLRENGQEDPIDITPDGVILDGRTRWALLRELGAETIHVRVKDMPEGQQVAWMVRRAVARRHLTTHQKRDLNEWLRAQVVEERPNRRGKPMRIGHSQTQRAAALGVDRDTVLEWDRNPLVAGNAATSPLPTHAIDGRGRPQPLHKAQEKRAPDRALDVTNGGRNLVLARAAKDRLISGLATMAGLAHGLDEINCANALAVASPEEITDWGVQIADMIRGLRTLNARLKGG